MLPLYVPIDPTWGKLTPQGAVAGYPLSIKDDILRSGLWGCARIGLSVLYSRISRPKIRNARDFARYWIGDYLLRRSGLESYMMRFFGIAAEKVDLDFAEKRMLWIKEHSSPRAMLRHLRPRKAEAPTNRQLARPKSGYDDLYAVAAAKLRGQGTEFRLGCTVSQIRKAGSVFHLDTTGGAVTADRVVSTIPINRALEISGLGADENLTSVTLISLFFSFSGKKGFDCAVLYNFSHGGFWKRLTMYSDFYGTAEGREYFGVEVIASQRGTAWRSRSGISVARGGQSSVRRRPETGGQPLRAERLPHLHQPRAGAGRGGFGAAARVRDRILRAARRVRLSADRPRLHAERRDAGAARAGAESVLTLATRRGRRLTPSPAMAARTGAAPDLSTWLQPHNACNHEIKVGDTKN